MIIRVGFDIAFSVGIPTPVILMLFTHPSIAERLQRPETLRLTPELPLQEYQDSFGNRCARLVAHVGELRLQNELLVNDSGALDIVRWDAPQVPVENLPEDVLQFLLSSRYCEVDLLANAAWELFGETPPGWARVQAICDWTHRHVTYGYEHASPTKTAFDVYRDGRGVCRDYQHLAISFCRSMNIPARYVSGYLGDIRIPPVPTPMDFHAWFEAYLGGQWYAFDARHNVPRTGRVPMSIGRDAVDVALTTSFGDMPLKHFTVIAEEVPPAA